MLVSLAAKAPKYFQTTFTESYGTQELSSVPIKAGDSKDIKLKVSPPNTVEPGTYPISVHISAGDAKADATLKWKVPGRPHWGLTGPKGLLTPKPKSTHTPKYPWVTATPGGPTTPT